MPAKDNLPRIEYGRIIKAKVIDPQGHEKEPHYLIIITKTEEITPGETFECVVITSKFPPNLREDDDEWVFLPWHRSGHPETKLKKKCAAMCSWLQDIKEEDIVGQGGSVPPTHLNRIMERTDALRE